MEKIMTLLQEVKSCPFCGCDDIETGLNWINCAKCSAGFNLCDKDTNANIEAWNRRAFADKLEGEEMVEKMVLAANKARPHSGYGCNIDMMKAALAVVRGMI